MPYKASELVTLACQVCNIPGQTAQVGKFLNMVLADYAQTIDEDIIRKTTTLSIGPQATIPYPYALPSDYLRYYDVFYLVNGEPFYLNPMELKDFDKLFIGSGISNYPDQFATDMAVAPGGVTPASAPNMYFYPPPSIALSVTVRYRPQTGDITTPESSSTIPWFPNQLTLFQDLCHKAMWLSDDSRQPNFKAEVDERMRKYLVMKDDMEGFAQTVKLDPRSFRPRSGFPSSKKTGF